MLEILNMYAIIAHAYCVHKLDLRAVFPLFFQSHILIYIVFFVVVPNGCACCCCSKLIFGAPDIHVFTLPTREQKKKRTNKIMVKVRLYLATHNALFPLLICIHKFLCIVLSQCAPHW